VKPHAFYEEVCMWFPPVWPGDHEWENVHDGQVAKVGTISKLVSRHIAAPEVVVVVHHLQLAAKMPKTDAAEFVAEHVLSGEIQISDPEFKSFVAIGQSGVATGWKK
jgi:hypothetical protein